MKRAAVVLAMTPFLAAPTAALADTVTVPAPPASSTGTALDVAGIVTIGGTSATAGPSSQTASGTALALGGQTVSGGDAKSGSANQGSLFDSGATPLGSLAIAPWDADAKTAGKSSSNAALARVTVIDSNTLAINVLQSHSDAQYNGSTSKGSSSSDGATVSLGGGALFLDILHADATSGGKGSSYLVSINGNEIGSDEQAGGQCAIDASPLLKLICLTATGGAGSTTSTANVGTVDLGGGQLTGTVSNVTGTGQPVAKTSSGATTSVKGEKIPNTEPSAGDTGNSGGLPFTGFPAMVLVAIAAILGVGGAMLQTVRRRVGLA